MNNVPGIFPQVPGMPDLEEMNRKNMEVFENAMKMFRPFNMTSSTYKEDEVNKG